jgi:hypothetical protein
MGKQFDDSAEMGCQILKEFDFVVVFLVQEIELFVIRTFAYPPML